MIIYHFYDHPIKAADGILLNSVRRRLEFIGGVPQLIVIDNFKSAVTQAHRYEPEVNKDFKAFAYQSTPPHDASLSGGQGRPGYMDQKSNA